MRQAERLLHQVRVRARRATRPPTTFKLEKTALGQVGIKVTADHPDASTYYSTFIGSPANLKNQGIGIATAGWGADFPTGRRLLQQSITNGNAILPTGNSNYASLNDPTVNKILDEAPTGRRHRRAVGAA